MLRLILAPTRGFNGSSYRSDIDYSATNNSQDTKSIENSTWHSMKADGENVTDEFAMRRGQQFGWGKLFAAAGKIKKAGGIDKLRKNSKGIQELGQGIHALQDAVVHKGEDMNHHSTYADMSPTEENATKAENVTLSAITVTEIMSGNYEHVTEGTNIDVGGMSKKQLNSFLTNLMSGMNDRGVKKVNIENTGQ